MGDRDIEKVSSLLANQLKIADQRKWVEPPGPYDTIHREDESTLIVTSWNDQNATPEQLEAFLRRWPPSRTPIDYCGWIVADRGKSQRYTPNFNGLKSAFQSLIASENVSVSEIDRIAIENRVLPGKWMLYSDSKRIDELWGKVVKMVCSDLKKGTTKVSPKQEGDSHVICVYVEDYTNMAEVDAMREALRAAGVFWRIGFKPDVYTHLGIYARNQWNIRPSRYFS
ncbi:hypothetical protein BDZ94DRAFT_587747 [Collybia nuda]|uniref:DUF1917 domain-containing protein n=1 Tax=Collybia nuda TaxID=64659 RepID=A0A9P5Y7V0_9AGAR|nr:hypothetical protein BDZ94DRAFT_587747 [Collybia nuda]